jgi:hypothetical protein
MEWWSDGVEECSRRTGFFHLLPPNSQSLISCNSTMAGESPSLFDLLANFEYSKGPETGRTYHIDHTAETISWIHPRLKDELSPNAEYRIDKASGKIYFVDHANKTTSLSHPRHKDFHRYADSEPEHTIPQAVSGCIRPTVLHKRRK